MKVKTISATYERKINLGNFNNGHIGMSVWADLAEGDDLHECCEALWQMLTENVRYKASQLNSRQDPDAGYPYLGLPIRFDDPAPSLNGHVKLEIVGAELKTEIEDEGNE